LNLTEPMSTGIGGDMFCLFYNAKTKKVEAMNGSGRAGKNYTLDAIRKYFGFKDGEVGKIPAKNVHTVTVPGAPAGWVDTVERFGSGKLTLEEILAPVIETAEKGFPVSEICSSYVSFHLGCPKEEILSDKLFSGKEVKMPLKMHHPTSRKCSKTIPKAATALPTLERFSKTLT